MTSSKDDDSVRLSLRSRAVDSSGIRKVFDLAQQLTAPINLSIGQPNFDVPEPVREEAKRWIDRGFNKYTLTEGINELRERLLNAYRVQGIDAEDVLITSGVSGGILLSLMALLDPGDEVLVPDPYFVMYKHLTLLIGGVPRFINTYPDFRLRAEAAASAITSRTKALFLASPSNPTGVSATEDELRAVASVAQRHDLLVIFDEIYAPFSYDFPHANIARFYPRTLVLGGFSKSHAMTGWRIGYALGPKALIREMVKLQQYTFVCAPSFAQKAAVTALDTATDEAVARYKRKRDMVYEALRHTFRVVRPDGAFYIFPEAPGGDGEGFVRRAIEKNVLIIPGSVFSERATHFRISYAADDDTLRRGLDILNSLV